jgi:hypothetical protein
MHDPAGREFGVDAHFVGDGIEQLVGYPDRKDILNQNRHDSHSLVVVLRLSQSVSLSGHSANPLLQMRVTFKLQVDPSSGPNEHAPNGGFMATATPTQHKPISWSTDSPLSRGELIDKLTEIGFHLQGHC